MKSQSILLISILTSVALSCSGKLVKDEQVRELDEKYMGEYVTTTTIDIGNLETMKAGTKVKLYFQSGKKSIKVYAYPVHETREQAMAKSIVILFKSDFPDEKYDQAMLEQKIGEVVRKEK